MPDESPDTNIIAFRLNTLEEMVQKHQIDLLAKLDVLIEKQQARETAMALASQRQEQLQHDLGKLESRVETHDSKLVKLQITLAERLGPGALAGGATAIAIEVLKLLTLGV